MTNPDTVKKWAIHLALEEREKAILLPKHTTKVGAAVYTTDDTVYGGFNMQNRSHKSYHAEETCLICCMLSSVKPETLIGMVITYSDNNLNNLTFTCGHCRQMLWEYTHNPKLLITKVDLNGNILAEKNIR